MTNALHASYYADRAVQRTVEIIENVQLAKDTFRVRFACREIAESVVPGQFLMLRLADINDPLIGRPLALYNVVGEALDVVYLVKGKFTSQLRHHGPGDRLTIWGPLGNGFSTTPTEHLIMVAGGIGQTPFLALGEEFLSRRTFGREVTTAKRVTLCYGARSAEYLAGVDDFQNAGFDVRLATDDGTRGQRGFVTDLLREVLAESSNQSRRIVVCGPEPMMEAVAKIAAAEQVACEVSLETPMACGIGICFTCVAKVRDEHGEWDYKRTCVEGPIFDAAAIEW